MDKDLICQIIGDLYLANLVLTREKAALAAERDELRSLVEQLQRATPEE